jgi:hypothetical protein
MIIFFIMTSFDTSKLVERGQSLGADIHTFADGLSAASRSAIEATNPGLEGTELGDEWPLSVDFIIEKRLAEMVSPTPRSIGSVAVRAETPASFPVMFLEDKIRNDALEQAYGSEAPRHAFARDILGWVSKMEQESWSLLVRMSVADEGRVELGVYEDNDATRAYFDTLTNGSCLTPEDIAGGAKPYAWLGERVIVDDPTFASEVLSTLK